MHIRKCLPLLNGSFMLGAPLCRRTVFRGIANHWLAAAFSVTIERIYFS